MQVLSVVCFTLCVSVIISSNPIINRSQGSKSKCSSTTFTFSLTSIRNKTGQWTSKVELQHGGDETALPWNVHVDHTTVQCNDDENVGISATVSVKPGPGYELIKGLGFYKVYKVAKVWDEARKTCNQDGAHLLIINSGAEMDAIKNLWSRNSGFTETDWQNYIHIGAHHLYKEGEFVTVLDQPLSQTGYEVWDKNEPNNSGGKEYCMSLKNTGGLNDVGCQIKLAFICEREL